MKNAASGSNFLTKPDIGSKFGIFVCGEVILGGVSEEIFWVFLVKFIVIEILLFKYCSWNVKNKEIFNIFLFQIYLSNNTRTFNFKLGIFIPNSFR